MINPNYPKYDIQADGRIYSFICGQYLILSPKADGYVLCFLKNKNNKIQHVYLHRLVYETFMGNIPKGLEINHIDENKQNNALRNLQLMTHKDNCNYGTRNNRIKNTWQKYSKMIKSAKNEESGIFRHV